MADKDKCDLLAVRVPRRTAIVVLSCELRHALCESERAISLASMTVRALISVCCKEQLGR